METVGEATWAHSVRALKPGGTIVISGATTGDAPPAELDADVLPPAVGDRIDDGHPRRSSSG